MSLIFFLAEPELLLVCTCTAAKVIAKDKRLTLPLQKSVDSRARQPICRADASREADAMYSSRVAAAIASRRPSGRLLQNSVCGIVVVQGAVCALRSASALCAAGVAFLRAGKEVFASLTSGEAAAHFKPNHQKVTLSGRDRTFRFEDSVATLATLQTAVKKTRSRGRYKYQLLSPGKEPT